MKKTNRLFVYILFMLFLVACSDGKKTVTPSSGITDVPKPTEEALSSATPIPSAQPTQAQKKDYLDIGCWVENKGNNEKIVESSSKSEYYWKTINNNKGISYLVNENESTNIRYAVVTKNTYLKTDVNIPINIGEAMIVHQDDDSGENCYVKTMYSQGWISKGCIGFMTKEDFTKYQYYIENTTSGQAVAAKDTDYKFICFDNVEEYNRGDVVYEGQLRIGTELYAHLGDLLFVSFPIRDENGNAKIITVVERHDGEITDLSNNNVIPIAGFTSKKLYNTIAEFIRGDSEWHVNNVVSIKAIYSVLGVRLPANYDDIVNISNEKNGFTGKNAEEKVSMLKQLPVGSILDFSGKLMLYMGEAEDAAYAFNPEESMIIKLDQASSYLNLLDSAIYIPEVIYPE